MKTMENDYPLIPMSDITDEARKIAVAWCEVESEMLDWIGHKHKLASDIMNYARRYHENEVKKLSKTDVIKSVCEHEFVPLDDKWLICKKCDACRMDRSQTVL
jgi:hypothetical protein